MGNDKFEMSTGQAHELAKAFARNGWTSADVHKLSEGDNLAQILSVLLGDIELTPIKSHSRRCVPELIPKGWLVMPGEVTPSIVDVVDIVNLKLRNFFKEGEESISGDELRDRAANLNCNFGLVDGARILAEADKLPSEFKRWRIPLPGTVLFAPDGKHCIPCIQYDSDHRPGLSWSSGKPWSIGSYPLNSEFQSYLYRFAYIE